MTRSHYDAWHNLLLLIAPDNEHDPYPTLQPMDDPCYVVATYPDGSETVLVYRNNQWVFADQLQPVGFGMPGN